MKLSNLSLTSQIIIINLIIITISFFFFGLLNFYITSKNLSLQNKEKEIIKLSDEITNYISNSAIENKIFTTTIFDYYKKNDILGEVNRDPIKSRKVITQTLSQKEDLDSYKSQKALELYYRNIKSNIKIYDSNLAVVASNNLVFSQYSIDIKPLELTNNNKVNFFNKYKNFYMKSFINFWHKYSRIKYGDILKPEFNETTKIVEIIKKQKKLNFFVNHENFIEILYMSPLIKNNNIYGVVVISDDLRQENETIAELSFNLFNSLILLILIVTLISFFYARSIAKPIKILSYITDQYREHRRIKKNIFFPNRKDEIGQLSKNLRIMSEELLNKINELERFAADVSHELKNPLTSIKGASEVLKNTNMKDTTHKKLISIIAKDSIKMNKLITDISNYTRTKAEIEKIELENVNIYDLLENLKNNYMDNNKNIIIRNKILQKNYISISNYEKLAQVISNILDNAISFSPRDSYISITFELMNDVGKIRIADQGCGIKKEYSKKIFERFYTDRVSESGEHSGLGLDIAKNIVESYGGKIYLGNNMEGYEGACFVIELPVKEIF